MHLFKQVKGRVSGHAIIKLSGIGLILIMFTLSVLPGDLSAQDNPVASVDIRFWAFSSNPQIFAYQTTNHLEVETFVVGQVGAPEPLYTQTADVENSPRDILVSQEIRDIYGWSADGVTGIISPSGRTQISIYEIGSNLSVTAMHMGQSTPLGTITRISDSGGTNLAVPRLHEVRWSPDESVVVVVVEQTLAGQWPMRVQTAHGFSAPGQ
jgi:hypothetical protein